MLARPCFAKTRFRPARTFIRTTSEYHKKGAQELWRLCDQAGYIYKGEYAGWYCHPDNAFVDGPPDGVPAGMRRVTLDVTLIAGAQTPMRYAGDKFGLSVGGEQLTPFRVDLPGDTLRPRSQLSGQLVFDVPRATATAALTLSGRPLTAVTVPVDRAAG